MPAMRALGVDAVRSMVAEADQLLPPPPPIHSATSTVVGGPHGDIPIRVYRPVEGAAVLPALVYIHGGGWTFGELDGFESLCRTLSIASGCVVVSVEYRLAPEYKFPIPVDDCEAALGWVMTQGTQLGIDTERLALAGDSAGANLAIAAFRRFASRSAAQSVRALVLVYPATEHSTARPSWRDNSTGPMLTTDDIEWLWEQYLRNPSDLHNPEAIPSIASDLETLPPTFVQTAEYDPLRDGGEYFAQKLVEAGVPTALKRYEGVFHGFYPMIGLLTRASLAVADSAEFVRRELFK